MVAAVALLLVVDVAAVAESHQEECYCWRRTIRKMATVVVVAVVVARHELLLSQHTETQQQPAEEEERRIMDSSPAWVLHALQKQTKTKTFQQLHRHQPERQMQQQAVRDNSYLADEAGNE
jgi:glycerol-3-phosphate cytidylyltransferase-like family protein